MPPVGDLAQWGSTIVIALALVLTIRRNGKGQKVRDEEAREDQAEKERIQAEKQSEKDQLQAAREAARGNELKHIKKALDHPKYGLAAIQEITKAATNARIPVFLKNSLWPLYKRAYDMVSEPGLRQEMPGQ